MPSTPPAASASQSPQTNTQDSKRAAASEPSTWALPLFLVVLASSAGFTMYTKKSGAMLRSMEQVNQNILKNRPPKYGPPTKEQYEKLRPRLDKDEFF